eukprot:TRINITY_DN9611_c0_g1_i1.p1 TRINITY_DN9611_c0_g1~~TRINITY_DN9611_c0_g1_i1.p1  ORF type:complete len:163 (-),score=14.87 TRINITY_DN9611_c0_g1_i1:509-940(-)
MAVASSFSSSALTDLSSQLISLSMSIGDALLSWSRPKDDASVGRLVGTVGDSIIVEHEVSGQMSRKVLPNSSTRLHLLANIQVRDSGKDSSDSQLGLLDIERTLLMKGDQNICELSAHPSAFSRSGRVGSLFDQGAPHALTCQ